VKFLRHSLDGRGKALVVRPTEVGKARMFIGDFDLMRLAVGRFDIRPIYELSTVATGNNLYYCLVTAHELF
jgi:hypothetical protein